MPDTKPTMTVDQIIAALNEFVAESDTNGDDLYDLLGDDFKALPVEDKTRVLPAMFDVMERSPDADLGSPGPLIHAIESLGVAAYEQRLAESVRRRPMYLNLWMVNRILNVKTDASERATLLGLLRGVRKHPLGANVVQEAEGFLEHQAKRSGG